MFVDVMTQTLQDVLRILDAPHDFSVSRPDSAVGVMGETMGGLPQPQGHWIGRSEIEIDAAHHPCTHEVRRNAGVMSHIGHALPREACRKTRHSAGVVSHIRHALPREACRKTRRGTGAVSHSAHTLSQDREG
jgi:hypothetical protein